MSETSLLYDVKCRSCRTVFKVPLYDTHERNLFMVSKKDWYCDACKKRYFQEQSQLLESRQGAQGFPPMTGTAKSISWALKIRGELLQKADYYKKSLNFPGDAEKRLFDQAFAALMAEWRAITAANWWIDHRTMNVRDISKKIESITIALSATVQEERVDE